MTDEQRETIIEALDKHNTAMTDILFNITGLDTRGLTVNEAINRITAHIDYASIWHSLGITEEEYYSASDII